MQTDEILKSNQLSITDSRKKILSMFLNSDGALAHADTIYRTLQVFVDKGIIHTIPTPDNSIKYALCKDDCAEGHHHDHHVHFQCKQCGVTYCLDDVTTPDVKLPKGYAAEQIEVVISGVCKNCKQ
jgi:Fur family transcriptional regulator, ferric uptake regulator